MTMYLVGLLSINCLIGWIVYKVFYRKRKLYNDRFGMVMAMSCSGILSLNMSMIFQFLFVDHIFLGLVLTVLIGVAIGVAFGSLVKFQSLLAGFSYGVVGSLMGNMLGIVIKDPSICSLPAPYFQMIEKNMMIFSVFGSLLVLITILLVYYSLRV